MILSKLGKREKYIAYAAVLILGLFVFDRLVLNPLLGKLSSLNTNGKLKERELSNALQLIAQKELINSEYEKYTKNIKQTLSNEKETAQLLSEIEKIAKETDVSLTRMKPSRIKEEDFYKEYIVQVEAEAVISNLVEFLYKLERTSKLIRAGEFRLVPKQKNSAVLKMDLTIKSITVVEGQS
ncbi:MAG: type 4a pilus biogenesis protein PilO [Candidatus Omnitrophica bacterium]|nr:type 4a pilus biogenesis protein PilO [Candidatus Omnitrophota bacterium]MCF7878946.1 type 4a pilus biogenesis protein PilO [Candidatus Omnitrophota bacterium]